MNPYVPPPAREKNENKKSCKGSRYRKRMNAGRQPSADLCQYIRKAPSGINAGADADPPAFK